MEKIRFSTSLSEFNVALLALTPAELAPAKAAFAEHVAGKSFAPDSGRDADAADLDPVMAALPKELRSDVRIFESAFRAEQKLRGQNWIARSAVLTLVEGLPALKSDEEVAPVKAKAKGKK